MHEISQNVLCYCWQVYPYVVVYENSIHSQDGPRWFQMNCEVAAASFYLFPLSFTATSGLQGVRGKSDHTHAHTLQYLSCLEVTYIEGNVPVPASLRKEY